MRSGTFPGFPEKRTLRRFSTSNADTVSELSREGNSVLYRSGELDGEIMIDLINI